MTTNPWGQLLKQLEQQGNQAVTRTRKFNPRPPGVLQEGGAAKDVLKFLQANPDEYFTFSQLVFATDRTIKALDWACLELRRLDMVVTRSDPFHQRYLQYKFKAQEGGRS
jgi:hypothetical protein